MVLKSDWLWYVWLWLATGYNSQLRRYEQLALYPVIETIWTRIFLGRLGFSGSPLSSTFSPLPVLLPLLPLLPLLLPPLLFSMAGSGSKSVEDPGRPVVVLDLGWMIRGAFEVLCTKFWVRSGFPSAFAACKRPTLEKRSNRKKKS